jgi:hypothetical protein
VPVEKPQSVATLVQMVNNHLQKSAMPISVEVRECVTDLGYGDNGAKSLTVGGKVYLFRDRITSMADARDTLFHYILRRLRLFLSRSHYRTTMSRQIIVKHAF